MRCLRGKGSKVGYDLLEGAKRQGGAFWGKESKAGDDLREGGRGAIRLLRGSGELNSKFRYDCSGVAYGSV